MLLYIAKRFIRSIMTLIVITIVVFSLLRLMPIEGYFHNFDKLKDWQIQQKLKEMGLLEPLHVQIANFFKDALNGDFGVSRRYQVNKPAIDIIKSKIGISFKFGTASLLLALVLGLPLGVLMATQRGKFIEKFGTIIIVLIQAVPSAIYHLLIQVYGSEFTGLSLTFESGDIKSYILPLISLSLGNLAYYSMWLRRFMIDESSKDYVKLAYSKGLSSKQVMRRHIFRNAIVPLVQYIPSSFMLTIIGSIYVEHLYSIPGMGGLLIDVIKRQDNNMVQLLVILYSVISIAGLFLGDIFMAIADPRIKLSRKVGEN